MRKVIRLDEPKEEKQPKLIDITNALSGPEGWMIEKPDFDNIKKIIYLGKCPVDGDMFAFYTYQDVISIWKGHLNDGVY